MSRNKQVFFVIAIMGILFASCKKDFLDVNNDPNRPTDNNITPQQIFPAAATAVASNEPNGFGFAQNWVGYFASNGDFARDQEQTSYDIDFTFGNALWANYYNTLFDLYQVKNKSLMPDGDTVLAGAAMILYAKIFQEVVDVYGSAPYTQAFQISQYQRPVYDDAKNIYDDLQNVLDTAINYMKLTAPKTKGFGSVDIVNQGDQSIWIKFANTLKLRLLIRQSEVSGFDPSAQLAKIENNGGGFLGKGESVSVNPGYVNDVNKQSPFFANFGYTPTGTKATTSTNGNAYIINIFQALADPRISAFFAPVGNSFVGDTYGDEPGNNPSGAGSSYFGSGLIGPNTSQGASQDQWLYPSFESLFLQAEAIQRGWLPGDAQSALNDAIVESFVWLGLDVTDAESYMDGNPYTDLSATADVELTEVQIIAFQKYCALTGIDPLEAWSDIRRLDFLTNVDPSYISVNPSRISDHLPYRLLYPQTEQTTNGANVPKQNTKDQISSKIFWQP